MTTDQAAVISAFDRSPRDLAGDSAADWTIREIVQQPDIWEQTLNIVGQRRSELDAWLAPLLAKPELRIILTGAGTSAYAGRTLAPALTRALGRRIEAIATTDLVSSPDDYLLPAVPTLLISYGRSGNSPESPAALDMAERLVADCYHLVICCAPDSALVTAAGRAANAQVLLMPAASLDQSFAMTSSFTSMVVATLALLAPDDAQACGAIDAVRALIAAPAEMAKLVDDGFERVAFLGSGALFGLATEAALKVLELSAGKTDTYAETGLGFRHGPKFVVNEQTIVVVMTSTDPYTQAYDRDIAAELEQDATARSVVRLDSLPSLAGKTLAAPWQGLVYITWCQLLAYFNAKAIGNNPDNPCPTGEVNRVVQGVTIHPFSPVTK